SRTSGDVRLGSAKWAKADIDQVPVTNRDFMRTRPSCPRPAHPPALVLLSSALPLSCPLPIPPARAAGSCRPCYLPSRSVGVLAFVLNRALKRSSDGVAIKAIALIVHHHKKRCPDSGGMPGHLQGDIS